MVLWCPVVRSLSTPSQSHNSRRAGSRLPSPLPAVPRPSLCRTLHSSAAQCAAASALCHLLTSSLLRRLSRGGARDKFQWRRHEL